jgi:hypothetical protein
VQYTVLAEIPATSPADAHSTKKFGLHQAPTAPLSRPSHVSYKLLYTSYPSASSCGLTVFDDLYGQDSVFGSDSSGGFYDECMRIRVPRLRTGAPRGRDAWRRMDVRALLLCANPFIQMGGGGLNP